MRMRTVLGGLLCAGLAGACTVTSVGPEDGPPRIQSRGLIEGHAAIGMRAEERFFSLRVLDGESDGALAEVVVWKLLRLEIGALGIGVGVGPLDLALGALFYEPEVPRMTDHDDTRAVPAGVDDCEICAEIEAR
jgi:hypothetical protein